MIERDLRAAGFDDIEIDTITLDSRGASAEDGARGLVYGSPMGVELAMDDYGPDALDRVYETVLKAMREYEGPEGFGAPMTAHIVTAAK